MSLIVQPDDTSEIVYFVVEIVAFLFTFFVGSADLFVSFYPLTSAAPHLHHFSDFSESTKVGLCFIHSNSCFFKTPCSLRLF